MKPSRYIPGAWKGEKDGLLPLDADAWFNIMHKSQTEREREDKARTTIDPTSDKEAA